MIHSTSTTITPMTIQVTAVEDMESGSSEGDVYGRAQSMARPGRREAAHHGIAERAGAQIVALNGRRMLRP
jgi:hypothetical protein